MLEIVFNTLSFHIVGMVSSQVQKEPMENQGSHSHQYDHDIGYNNYLSINNFPIIILDDICFTLIEHSDIHGLSFLNSYSFQIFEALQHELMVMSGPTILTRFMDKIRSNLP